MIRSLTKRFSLLHVLVASGMLSRIGLFSLAGSGGRDFACRHVITSLR